VLSIIYSQRIPRGLFYKLTDFSNTLLEEVAQAIEAINDTRIRSNIAASTAVLAGLVLNKDLINRILRSDIMRESVIYQDILQEGLKEGFEQGLEQGLEQKAQEIARNMLNEGIAIALIVRVTGLTLEQVQQLQAQTGDNSEKR
jgi:predicted transposase/invertase (TIGR01784 family)